MPTLDWIGRDAVLHHHQEVPFHLLRCNPDLSVGDPNSGNLLVEGDNLLALKALLPHYSERVKCIYIDPPYNTGNESWVYNDNVNSPEIREWLGKVVGKEAEDLSRHDKWLCMMYPRLALLREFLRDDGVIFVSIDDNEYANLRLVMDGLFGADNRLGSLVWKRRSSSAMRGTPLSIDHEYVVVYAKDQRRVKLYGLEKGRESYPYRDERGWYASTDLTVGMDRYARPGQFYVIRNPRSGVEYPPNPERVWRFFPDTMQKVIADDLIIWPDEHPESHMTRPRYKTYYDPNSDKPRPISSWIEQASTNDRILDQEQAEYDLQILISGMNQEGGRIVQRLLGSKAFAYPKPLSLVRSLIRATTRQNDLVLDSFAGSATTAHAVLDLNNEDGGERRFILIELDPDICRNIAYERLKRVIEGYTWKDARRNSRQEEAVGGSFRYCELGETLFDAHGQIRSEVSFADLARHAFFSSTGSPLPSGAPCDTPLVGIHKNTAIYLLYNGIMGDQREEGGNVLTRSLLASLPPHNGPKVIYGEGCLLGREYLQEQDIVFRQTPYEIKVK